jgi:drug/metabolite transporter (DMT)-like permease
MTSTHGLAVALAALGAVLFGLAAVRQHGAVQQTMGTKTRGLRGSLRSFSRLVRQPSWLVGTVQAIVAGGLHVVALALAPITLVQPIGVLAVPVTVAAAAIRAKRRPSRAQVIGSALSVVGVVILTLVLLSPTTNPVILPSWLTLAVTVAAAVGVTVLVAAIGVKSPPLVRCVTLAAAAAALFGLNSILIRTIGHILASSSASVDVGLLITAVVGLALALPVGLWAMQTAYQSGSPHVVICCLTLLDPLVAVSGGNLLLHDGVALTALTWVASASCALLAAVGVVFLSFDYPAEPDEIAPAQPEASVLAESS